MQDCSNSIDNALELLQFCTKTSIFLSRNWLWKCRLQDLYPGLITPFSLNPYKLHFSDVIMNAVASLSVAYSIRLFGPRSKKTPKLHATGPIGTYMSLRIHIFFDISLSVFSNVIIIDNLWFPCIKIPDVFPWFAMLIWIAPWAIRAVCIFLCRSIRENSGEKFARQKIPSLYYYWTIFVLPQGICVMICHLYILNVPFICKYSLLR